MSISSIFNLSAYTPEQREHGSRRLLFLGAIGLLATAYTAKHFRTRPLRPIALGGLSGMSLLLSYHLKHWRASADRPNTNRLNNMGGEPTPLPDHLTPPTTNAAEPVLVDPMTLPSGPISLIMGNLPRWELDRARLVSRTWRDAIDSTPGPPFAFVIEENEKSSINGRLENFKVEWAIPSLRWNRLRSLPFYPSTADLGPINRVETGNDKMAYTFLDSHLNYSAAVGAIRALDQTEPTLLLRHSDFQLADLADVVAVSSPFANGEVVGILNDFDIVKWNGAGKPLARFARPELGDPIRHLSWERLAYDPESMRFVCSSRFGLTTYAFTLDPFEHFELSKTSRAFCLDTDRSRVFTADDHEIHIWNLTGESPTLEGQLFGLPSGPVGALHYEKEGALLFASVGSAIQAWEMTSRRRVSSFGLRSAEPLYRNRQNNTCLIDFQITLPLLPKGRESYGSPG